MATEVRWRVPKGFRVMPTQYPIPKRFLEDGDIVSFGYDSEVWLTTTIIPPSDYVGTADIAAEVDWLVCKETCYPGEAKLSTQVQVNSEPAKPSKYGPEIARRLQSVPVDPKSLGVQVRQGWTRTDRLGKWIVSLKFPSDPVPGSIRYFPFDPVQAKILELPMHHQDGEFVLELPVEIGGPEFDPQNLGVLVQYEERPKNDHPSALKPGARKTEKTVRAFVVRYEPHRK